MEVTNGNLKSLLHFAVIRANEICNPDDQNLDSVEDQVLISSDKSCNTREWRQESINIGLSLIRYEVSKEEHNKNNNFKK